MPLGYFFPLLPFFLDMMMIGVLSSTGLDGGLVGSTGEVALTIGVELASSLSRLDGNSIRLLTTLSQYMQPMCWFACIGRGDSLGG